MEREKVTMLRHRGSKLNKIKKMDMFTKVEESYKETSSVGATFSVFSFIAILWLIYSETRYYLDSRFVFKFKPDTDFDAKLKINVDITVAMPCSNVGADILDSTNQNAYKFGSLDEEDTWFELSPNQRAHFDNIKHLNSYLREEYHAIKDLMWRRSFSTLYGDLPPRTNTPNVPHDACRICGSLELNKVAGNFHITAGKSLNLPRGHIHISAFMTERDYNFSHRITKFNFGDPSPGIVHPLEADEIVTDDGMVLFNYFVEVVPTSVKTFFTSVDTYQYSVKALKRPIDHDKGSHGMPGIFFKYDMSALKVNVRQERDHFGMFLARLCSIIGGIYVCSGLLNRIIQFLYNFIICNWGKKQENQPKVKIPSADIVTSPPDLVPVTVL